MERLQVLKYFCNKYGLYFKLHDEKTCFIFRIYNEHILGNVKTKELNSMDTSQIEDFVLQCASGEVGMKNLKTLQMHCKKYGLEVHYNMLDRIYRIYYLGHTLMEISEELMNTMEESDIESLAIECALEMMG